MKFSNCGHMKTDQKKVKLENDSLVMFETGFNLSNVMCFQLRCTLVKKKEKEKTDEGTDSEGNWAWGMLVLDRGNGGWLGLLSERNNSSQISAESRDKHCHKDLSIF